eukprot:scaffold74932_cov31-Tisochrysis_lutea.AAC.2
MEDVAKAKTCHRECNVTGLQSKRGTSAERFMYAIRGPLRVLASHMRTFVYVRDREVSTHGHEWMMGMYSTWKEGAEAHLPSNNPPTIPTKIDNLVLNRAHVL